MSNAKQKRRIRLAKIDRNELERLKGIIQDGYEVGCKLGFLKIGESDHTTVTITLTGKHRYLYTLCVEDHQLIDTSCARRNQLEKDLNTIQSALEGYDNAIVCLESLKPE